MLRSYICTNIFCCQSTSVFEGWQFPMLLSCIKATCNKELFSYDLSTILWRHRLFIEGNPTQRFSKERRSWIHWVYNRFYPDSCSILNNTESAFKHLIDNVSIRYCYNAFQEYCAVVLEKRHFDYETRLPWWRCWKDDRLGHNHVIRVANLISLTLWTLTSIFLWIYIFMLNPNNSHLN